MMKIFHRFFLTGLLVLPLILSGCGVGNTLDIGTSFAAKNLASGVFVSERPEEAVEDSDLSFGPMWIVSARAHKDQRETTAHVAGLSRNKAVYRPGLGATLVVGTSEQKLREQAVGFNPPPVPDLSQVPWPMGDNLGTDPLPPEVDVDRINRALDLAFSEQVPEEELGTRAVVIVYKGRIIGERYAPGFDMYTPLASWSMTKSFTSALVGILVGQGRLDIHRPAPVPEWRDPEDPRSRITLDQLLRMSSGLEFDETYGDYESDVVQMLFNRYDAAKFAASKPLAAAPDTEWHYSSGTSNIVSRIVRHAVRGTTADYWMFPRRALMERIGMHRSTIEPDPSGTFVGSSLMYATARDWARFGMLYLNDGVWMGERILPEGWVKYSTTPTPLAPQGVYGAHWWLNAGEPDDPADRPWPNLPTDAYAAQGYEAQRVLIIPSRDVVIVRMGQSRPETAFNTDAFASEVLAAIDG